MVVSVRLLVLSKQYCGLITGLGLPESALVYKSYRYYQKGIYSSARELKQMTPPQRDLYIEMSTAGPMDSVLQLAPWVACSSAGPMDSTLLVESGHSEALVYLKKISSWISVLNYVQKMFEVNPEEN